MAEIDPRPKSRARIDFILSMIDTVLVQYGAPAKDQTTRR